MSDQTGETEDPNAETWRDVFETRTDDKVGRRLSQVWQLVIVLVAPIAIGALFIALGKPVTGHASMLAYSGFLIILFVSAFIVGGGVALIFAVPRSRTDAGQSNAQTRRGGLDTNTNLERISDWLTNGIVAIALVKLEDIGVALATFGQFAHTQFAGIVFVSIVSQCVLVSGGVLGFVFGYIQTRTSLTLTFNAIETLLARLRDALTRIDETTIQDPNALHAIAAARASVGQTAEAARTLTRAINLQGSEPAPSETQDQSVEAPPGEPFFADEKKE